MQHTVVERQPIQLAVDEQVVGIRLFFGHGCVQIVLPKVGHGSPLTQEIKGYHSLTTSVDPEVKSLLSSRRKTKQTKPTMAVLVGRKAPHFSETAVLNGSEIVDNFSLDQYLGNKYVVLFFYPKDFTFVCPTEIHAFQEKLSEFEARNCAVVGVSTDTAETHQAYLRVSKDNGGIEGVTYPLVADTNKTISTNYDVLAGEYDYDEEGNLVAEGEMIAYRGLFLIDKEGIVRHQLVNFFPIGRNVDEAIRVLDAWIHNETHGEVCPANWEKGKDAMAATNDGVAAYLASH